MTHCVVFIKMLLVIMNVISIRPSISNQSSIPINYSLIFMSVVFEGNAIRLNRE